MRLERFIIPDLIIESRKKLLHEYGIEKSINELHEGYKSLGMYEELCNNFGRKLDETEFSRIKQRYIEIQKELEEKYIYCFPGVSNSLKHLKDMHVTLAVLTNRPRASLDELLSFLGIKDFFDKTFTPTEFIEPKPSPLAMKFSLEQLEIESESNKKRVLYVGDDLPDCICGKEAGIATVLVPHARKFEELRSHFTYALSDMSELISLCSSGKT